MELIIGLILLYIAGYVFIVFILPLIVSVASLVMAASGIAAFVLGFFYALKNYITAIKRNINFRRWSWPKDPEPARRSYFFGPGFKQLIGTISTAFKLNVASGKKIKTYGRKIKDWGYAEAWILEVTSLVCSVIFTVLGYIFVYGIGTALCVALALIHGTITAGFMIVIYIIFTIVWIMDRLYLLVNKIRSDCPNCHTRYLTPMFECPYCGRPHKKLVPGPYGIFKHRCECGSKLPCTFFNGRSKLTAGCPSCGSGIVASDARPVVFQLIGGTASGKSVFLAAFFHEFLAKLSGKGVKYTIPDMNKPYFSELEDWFGGEDCPATARLNSQMSPVLIDGAKGVKRQFSIYDIGGEMFDGYSADSQIEQQQFHYCDGLIFLIDPFSNEKFRRTITSAEIKSTIHSEIDAEDVTTNFINYLIRTGKAKANVRCNIPIAVLIVKSDIREVKREIGPAKIRAVYNKNPEGYGTYENARDILCRQFLEKAGFSAAVSDLETQFTNLHYFPVSSMGHAPDGTEYEPWGVLDPVDWLLPLSDTELNNLINPPSTL